MQSFVSLFYVKAHIFQPGHFGFHSIQAFSRHPGRHSSTIMCEFEVYVSKEDFKFNCAHFIAYKGFRERLHGHNYRVSVRVTGSDYVNPDGYVLDFGDIKKAARKLCKSLNEYFICPMKSTDMVISEMDGQVCLQCEDGSKFSFPRSDCAMLPIVHSSAEELAHWMWCSILRNLGLTQLEQRGLKSLEVSVSEADHQLATFRGPIPTSEEALLEIENRPVTRRPAPCCAVDAD